jgi:hypothetical protein
MNTVASTATGEVDAFPGFGFSPVERKLSIGELSKLPKMYNLIK